MGRIRTIKPEFPQSESVGRLSRDARLLFILLWTLADDSGRCRAASRMLASLLYPHDADASGLMDDWLAELEAEGMIRRYMVGGSRYLEIVKWLDHQKIDRPSKSRLPVFADASTKLIEPSRDTREPSSGDRDLDRDLGPGPRTGKGEASDASHRATALPAALPPVQPESLLDLPLNMIRPLGGDWRVALFRQGLTWLADQSSKPPDKLRPLVGRWLRQAQDDAKRVFDAIAQAQAKGIADVVPWIEMSLKREPPRSGRPRDLNEIAG